jgi:glycosyltransferase involved in cell wall biosynthesis
MIMRNGPSSPARTRVLLVAPQPTYEDRGTPIAVVHVLQALSELGCDTDVLTYPIGVGVPLPGVRWFRTANPLGFEHVPVGLSWRKLALDLLMLPKMASMLRKTRYDYIHAVEEAAFPAALLGRLMGIPLLYDMQSSIPQHLSRHAIFGARWAQAFLRRCERWLLSRADLVVASAGLESYVREHAPAARVAEWRFPAAIFSASADARSQFRKSLCVPDEAKTVVYSGTFSEYQGLPALVQAARTVVSEHPATVFIAVGGSRKDSDDLKRLVSELDLDPHFRIMEREPRERALAYLDLADILVSPRAHGNNLPLKIADYMAATKPIVATKIPAHTIVLDTSRAVLTEPDADDLARGILSVLENAQKANRLAEAARAYGDQHMSWPAFRRSVSRQVRHLLGDGARPYSLPATVLPPLRRNA